MPLSHPSEPRVLEHQVMRLRRHARIAAIAIGTIALLTLASWAMGLPLLRSVLPGHVEMKANTAIGLLLASAALAGCGAIGRLRRRVSPIASLLLLLLGATVLIEYVFDADLGIGTLLFDDPSAAGQGRVPGQMSQISAISFVMAGIIGLDACRHAGHWLGQALAVGLLGIALFSLSAYGYAMGTTMAVAGVTPVGLNTAVALFLLALGWLVSSPRSGLARTLIANSLGGELARRLLLPALLVPVVVSVAAQMSLRAGWVSEGAAVTLLSMCTGLLVAAMIWWASRLLDGLEQQRRVSRELRASALTDELTSLGNRRAFDEALDLLSRGDRADAGSFSLMMLDLDHFKRYNDSHGHLAGDQALRVTGALLREALRPGDVATRFGGEEFAVLLPATDLERARLVGERIARDFRIADWPFTRLTASIGVAEARPGETAEALVERADQALYAAKLAGRDRVAVAPQSASA